MYAFPIVVEIPAVLGDDLVKVPITDEFHISQVGGSLRVAAGAGNHTVRIRNPATGVTLFTVTFAPGETFKRFPALDIFVPSDSGLAFDLVELDPSALDCVITVWGAVVL